MARIKISSGILCVLVGLSIFFAVWINNRCSYMLSEITEICSLLDSGDTERAVQLAESLDEEWNNFRKKATVMLKNNELTEIDCISSGIPYLIENDNDESYAKLMEFQYMLIMLKDGEVPTLTRVL
ncbi:MAG: DUF4363 family protein [Ruminococcus flavefaciens]|nr:DUF4363 family protein [Ruminococcus flavefaciens]